MEQRAFDPRVRVLGMAIASGIGGAVLGTLIINAARWLGIYEGEPIGFDPPWMLPVFLLLFVITWFYHLSVLRDLEGDRTVDIYIWLTLGCFLAGALGVPAYVFFSY